MSIVQCNVKPQGRYQIKNQLCFRFCQNPLYCSLGSGRLRAARRKARRVLCRSLGRVIDLQRFSHFDRAMMRILHTVNIKVVDALFKNFEPKMLMDRPTTSQPGH